MWRWLLLRAMAAERRPLSALLLPGWLGTQDSEAARQGAMFVFCVHLANGVVLAAALLFLALGFPGTALNVLGTVVVHLALLALFFRSRRALLVSHLLVLAFFVEVNWDFGPDGGFGFLGVVVIPLVAITLLGVRWGLVWTAFCVVWCAWLVPYHFFPHTYAAVVPGASAVLSAVIGIGAAVIELTRARASQDAGASLARQRQAESTMQRFLGTAFPAHAYASNGLLTSVSPGV